MSSAMSAPDNGLDRPRVSQSHYGRSFFELQLHFARTVAALSGMSLARALLQYTNLYVRFGLGRAFDPDHPTWREYLAGLARVDDGVEWTHRFYLTRSDARAGPAVAATFGCFSYALPADGRLRLHFRNAETGGRSPLAIEGMERRVAELRALFLHVRQSLREPLRVVGASWLYNLPAYRRLFPDSYLASARVLGGRFQHMPLWGQFVDRHGEVRNTMARSFLERVERQASVGGLEECFPFQVLSPEAPVRDFDAFYGLPERR